MEIQEKFMGVCLNKNRTYFKKLINFLKKNTEVN